eukprot:5731271-Alexandrium_andersonii.AAC.1
MSGHWLTGSCAYRFLGCAAARPQRLVDRRIRRSADRQVVEGWSEDRLRIGSGKVQERLRKGA